MTNAKKIELTVIALEDTIAHLVGAENALRCVGTRLMRFARTDLDAANVRDITAARVDIEKARGRLVRFHPNRRT
jgi:hypothetical protein